ncbi:MAG: glycosyltransferase [Pseudonocardiaceae bacterium]
MTRIGVVVPAHDEQELLPYCLAALHRAAAPVRAMGIQVDVVVVLDACTDGSAEQATRAGVSTIEVAARNVGAARAAGFETVLEHGTKDVWLATTDADSTVPPHWLLTQLTAFRAGWDAFVGTVRVVDWAAHPPEARARYLRRYQFRDDHPHVHGANLGISARSYRLVGGIPALATGEDVALVAALDMAQCAVLRSPLASVTTSARHRGRAPDGFATHVCNLTVTPIWHSSSHYRRFTSTEPFEYLQGDLSR